MDWSDICTNAAPFKPVTTDDIFAAMEDMKPIAAKIREADAQIAREVARFVGQPVENVRVEHYDPLAKTFRISYTVKPQENPAPPNEPGEP